jgi:hypothetical protein
LTPGGAALDYGRHHATHLIQAKGAGMKKKRAASTKGGKKAAKPAARKKLKMKDLTAGRRKGSVRGGAIGTGDPSPTSSTTSTSTSKVQNLEFRKIIPCV